MKMLLQKNIWVKIFHSVLHSVLIFLTLEFLYHSFLLVSELKGREN
jgi:hypothetical protein